MARLCLYDTSLLPRWHQDDRGIRNAHRGVHEAAVPGAYRGIPAWHGREHWLTAVLPAALDSNDAARRRHGVNHETMLRWARIESGYVQDQRTGRRCIVRPDTVASVMGATTRTVQRCRALARELGVYVDVVPGRMLTLEECHAARRAGSRQRGLSNETAFTIPPGLLSAVDTVTPTRGRASHEKQLPKNPSPRSQHEQKAAASRRRPDPTGRARRLAHELIAALAWLRGESPGRIAPCLTRFALADPPWTAADLAAALHSRNLRLGRSAPTSDRIRTRPAAMLAVMLRDLDEADRHVPEAWGGAPPPPPAPCGGPNCDHGWVTVAANTVAKCPRCAAAVRRPYDDTQPVTADDAEPPF